MYQHAQEPVRGDRARLLLRRSVAGFTGGRPGAAGPAAIMVTSPVPDLAEVR